MPLNAHVQVPTHVTYYDLCDRDQGISPLSTSFSSLNVKCVIACNVLKW